MSADRQVSQLHEVADVVGDLGCNIAAAQKLLNKDYVDSLKALMRTAADHLGEGATADARAQALLGLLRSLAPSRYQFTETVVEFAADLAESKQRSAMIGGGATFKMLQVNAALSMGYGEAYRSAARITATIHAVPEAQLAATLLDRAVTIEADAPPLPLGTAVDQEIYDGVREIWTALEQGNDPTPTISD
jgi:hypothetical protein